MESLRELPVKWLTWSKILEDPLERGNSGPLDPYVQQPEWIPLCRLLWLTPPNPSGFHMNATSSGKLCLCSLSLAPLLGSYLCSRSFAPHQMVNT